VLDHLAKPLIEAGVYLPWQDDLISLAAHPNVFCKLSGMATEAAWKHWKPSQFKGFLDLAFQAFGAERLMIGSDWPVCTLSADYS
jgi:L-fuconolactonase